MPHLGGRGPDVKSPECSEPGHRSRFLGSGSALTESETAVREPRGLGPHFEDQRSRGGRLRRVWKGGLCADTARCCPATT